VEDVPNEKVTEETLGEQANGGPPSVVQNGELKMSDGKTQGAFIQDGNDEDAGLAARGELDDAETKRELAGL
jgi:hypothetical protein